MIKLIGAAALAIALAAPASAFAQQSQTPAAPPSPLAALDLKQELRLTPEQVTRLESVRDGLKEAHRTHCGP
ncbi:MAG TPA: hypothetical protein VFR81_23735, partial [Longimicrobium sp.]|nr:hypothetical protein [Longimicrobium sp.]